MSISSKRGKDFELLIAKMIRSKLNARIIRDKRSGAGVNKADVSDWFKEIPLHIEAKDQATIKVKEWFRQAVAAATGREVPTVVFRAENEILSVLRLEDLLNLLAEIGDQRDEISNLRSPIKVNDRQLCKNGHIADEFGYCLYRGCKFSRGYKFSKPKRSMFR